MTTILFIGPSLVGKGTQCDIINHVFDLKHFSSGEIMRNEVKLSTQNGLLVKEYMNKGELVPNELVSNILINEIIKYVNEGILFDGLVREYANLLFLDDIVKQFNLNFKMVIYLNADYETTKLRLINTNRNRNDDNLEIFKNRYTIFTEKINPVLNEYRKRGILYEIDATKTMNEISVELISLIIKIYNFQLNYLFFGKNKLSLNMFYDVLLKNTINNRCNVNRRIILIATNNNNKFNEYYGHLKLYGLEVYQIISKLSIHVENELINKKEILAIIKDNSYLIKTSDINKTKLENFEFVDGLKVSNICKTRFLTKSGEYNYESCVNGMINFDNMSSKSFGWDDCFKVYNLTYDELKIHHVKISARNQNISKFIDKHINTTRLDKHKDILGFADIKMNSGIDFTIKPQDYINNELYNKSTFANIVLNNVLDSGVFFRSTPNRRIKNYWCPGLNAGIPLTRKNDMIHEYTYILHDFFHFVIPDLIFTGTDNLKIKKTYIYWRMMSEAVSMTMADMLFIDEIAKYYPDYDFSKRKIYPLFVEYKNTHQELSKDDLIKKVLKNNFEFCITGNCVEYEQLIAYKDFKNKYESFFVGDIQWTNCNYKNMVKNCDSIRLWYKNLLSQILNNTNNINNIIDNVNNINIVLTTEYVANELPDNFMIDDIFEFAYERFMKFTMENEKLSDEKRLERAFNKYKLGQLYIFFKFDFVKESMHYYELCKNEQDINKFREIYNEYLDILQKYCILANDDKNTYSEIFPLFEPSYLNYENCENKLIKDEIEKIFIVNENITLMEQIIINCGGIVDENLFVIKPAIKMITECDNYEANAFITFLIAGISIETSMELIAHKEAMVARLTTSKTTAMLNPLYRVMNKNSKIQKHIIKEYIMNIPKYDLNMETRNMLNPGNKSTILLYTMKIIDYHRLFIGRAPKNGNEYEVREVVQLMHNCLHNICKNIIVDWDIYENAHNSLKQSIAIHEKCVNNNKLTKYGHILKNLLNINLENSNIVEADDYLIFCAIQSKITYLDCKKLDNYNDLLEYVRKIVIDYGHKSIAAGFQIAGISLKELINDKIKNLLHM